MPVTATHLTTDRDADGGATSTTASISPSSNKLVLMAVFWAQAGNPADGEPSVSGASMTWDQVTIEKGNSRGIKLFRALSASPGSGALTISFTGSTPNWCAWTIAEFGEVDTTGSNGINAVVQSVDGTNGGSSTSLTLTLAAFSSTDNATAGFFGFGGTNNVAGGAGFTELGSIEGTSQPAMLSEWRSDNDTTVDATKEGGADDIYGAAVEIKFVASSTTGTNARKSLLGVGL